MRSQRPDFTVGYGTEVEESTGSFNYLPWVLAFVALAAVYVLWRRKQKARKKR
jgi:hypothetical protein